MKSIVMVLCLLFPGVAAAQNPNMNGVDMQKMMLVMQEMQQCMAKVDQTELKALEEQSDKMGKEIEALCEKGERKKAQKKAIAYSKKMMKNPALVKMKKCGEITKGMMPEGSTPPFEDEFDYSSGQHVCDE